jgi:hypothetical protein
VFFAVDIFLMLLFLLVYLKTCCHGKILNHSDKLGKNERAGKKKCLKYVAFHIEPLVIEEEKGVT